MRPTTLTLFDAPFLATLPGGATPGTLGPVRWWDAASIGFQDGSIITGATSWADKSPNEIGATPTGGHEPVFFTTAMNGKPVVRLQGQKRFLFNSGELVLPGDFTILCVLRAQFDSIFISHGSFNRQVRANQSNAARSSWFSGESGLELTSNLFLSDSALPRMVGYRRSDNASTLLRNFYFFDNVTKVEPTVGPTGSVSSVAFGVNQIGIIDGGPLNLDIGELVIYDKALTDLEIQGLYNSYFKPKFSLP